LTVTLQVLKEYFTEVVEESIRDNFVVTYELLDEMLDFGYPQVCDARLLKEYVLHRPPFLPLQKNIG
jgi:AP-1 complex subunit mu